MTTADDRGPTLDWTGERYVPQVSGNIRLEHLHRYLLARELASGRRVLDIACGEGYGSDLLAGVATHVVGVDIVPEVVRHARRRYRRSNLAFAAGTCAAVPLADHSIDLVVCFETLEHHDQHDQMMRELKRVLRPGGVLIVSSPDRREYSEVPDYRNPFHEHELDRSEFARLVGSHFAHVQLVGQRVRAGSVVGPLEADQHTAFISFQNANDVPARTDGLLAPLYFIGVATDGPMPRVPSGLFDGGGFVWSTDQHAAAVAAAAAAEARVEALCAVLQGEILRRGERIDELDRARADVQALTNDAQAELERARRQLALARGELSEALAQLEAQSGREASLETANRKLLERLRHRHTDDRARDASLEELREHATVTAAALADLERLRETLAARLALVEGSHSWVVTSPLRASRRLVDRGVALGRKILSDASRAAYRGLPLTPGSKRRLKESVFRATPVLVRHTAAYRAWRLSTTAAPAPALPDAAAIVADATPGDATPVAAPAAAPLRRFDDEVIEYVPLTAGPAVETRIKAIAFYLPQFHPIPENDQWWGKGFTEWHNVARGQSRFPGHYQPHLPGELGFYDLRLVEVQRRQIELARTYGLHGFCYHHYWFGGKRLLYRPVEQLLANADLDFPFCLCWANENWTRRWDGMDSEVLIAQQHSAEDDLAFIRDLEPALRDRRYIHVDGRPLLIVYRPGLLPDAKATARRWREYCRAAGLPELFLMSAQAFERSNPRDFGFDAALEFPPNNMAPPRITDEVAGVDADFAGTIYDYAHLVQQSRDYESPLEYLLFRGVAPMWDNEARRPGRGAVFAGSTPALYREWLENACRHTLERMGDDAPFVFINAWNEWAEGAHLEPDRMHGYAYLQATADALGKFPVGHGRPSIVVVSHDAYFHGAQRLALALTETLSGSLGYDVHVLLCGIGPLASRFALAGQVHDFHSTAATAAVRERTIRELYAGGARVALCNTSVVGDTVEMLKAAGFRVVSMIHELPGMIGQYGLEASIGKIARDADRVVFPAAIVRDRFMELTELAPEKALIRPQGLLAPNRFAGRRDEARRALRVRLGLAEDARIVLAVGYADHRKGIDLFVEVCLRLMNQLPDVAFVWVGHHQDEAFAAARDRIDQADADARFLFPGLVEDPDVFFAGADVYLMTSREDPFPLVVLDALDAELPTIGFEGAGGFVELLERNCGVLVPYLDTAAMAEAATRLLDHPEEGRPLREAGKAIIDQEFSFTEYARALVQFTTPASPRVSVVVPNYNYERYLRTRLRSILAQTYRPHEIIFLDDCSSDGSVALAEELLAAGGVPYRIIRNAANQGVYRQWLRGIHEATGDLVWIAEADDECSPALLETLVPAFAQSSVVLAYCQSKQIDGAGRVIAPDYLGWTEDVHPDKWRHAYVRRGSDELRDSLVVKNTIPNVSALLMRRPDLSEIEVDLLALRNAGDWLLYVHLLERGDLAFVPDALNYHRRHSESVTIGHGGLNLMRETLLVQRYVLDRHQVPADVERKREAHLQATYEYLGLQADGPASYKDHEALRPLTVLAG